MMLVLWAIDCPDGLPQQLGMKFGSGELAVQFRDAFENAERLNNRLRPQTGLWWFFHHFCSGERLRWNFISHDFFIRFTHPSRSGGDA